MPFQTHDKREERWNRNSLVCYLPKIEEMIANTHHFRYKIFTNGWVVWRVRVRVHCAYLSGFKILPSVQFSARMWHVAILVTSGLRRAIYRPPSAASTIYLPLPFLLSRLRHHALSSFFYCLSLSLSLSIAFLLSFSLPLSSSASFFLILPFFSRFLFLSRPSLTIELNQRWNARYLNFDISNFRPRYFAISTVTELQTRVLVNNLTRNIS